MRLRGGVTANGVASFEGVGGGGGERTVVAGTVDIGDLPFEWLSLPLPLLLVLRSRTGVCILQTGLTGAAAIAQ